MQEMLMQHREKEKVVKISNGKEKVVFITGGSIGIGRETCYIFAKSGWNVVFSYFKHPKEAKEVEKKCNDLGSKDVLALKIDVRESKEILNGVKEIVKKFGHIDVLINNAGVIVWKELIEQEDDEIENQLRTNLEGLIKVTKYCLPYIREAIINISSGAGKQGYRDLVTYCASKFGVRGFTQALAAELPRIKVYSVNPGTTKTRMTDFSGVEPSKVAEIIYNATLGKFKIPNGGDVDVWEHL